MLVEFSVKNYKAFKEKATLSMIADTRFGDDELPDNTIKPEGFNITLLKSLVIYGANASGKSQLLQAMEAMRSLVESSFSKYKDGDEIEEIVPHLLHSESEKEPTEMEVVFIAEGAMYRYGFLADKEEVHEEWLYEQKAGKNTKEVELFYRDGLDLEYHNERFKVGKMVQQNKPMLRENSLALSFLFRMKDEKIHVIQKQIMFLNQITNVNYPPFHTIEQLDNEWVEKTMVLAMLKNADFGIVDFEYEKKETEMQNKKGTVIKLQIDTQHRKYGKGNEKVTFNMREDESMGTQKYFSIAGPVMEVLSNGEFLAIDELDSSLHPVLVHSIVKLFHSPKTNPKNAQFIVTTHDTNLLSPGMFRRDQVWFTEKDRQEAAHLYSLAEFKTSGKNAVRKGEDYEQNYIRGKYGAIPYIGDFSELFMKEEENGDEQDK